MGFHHVTQVDLGVVGCVVQACLRITAVVAQCPKCWRYSPCHLNWFSFFFSSQEWIWGFQSEYLEVSLPFSLFWDRPWLADPPASASSAHLECIHRVISAQCTVLNRAGVSSHFQFLLFFFVPDLHMQKYVLNDFSTFHVVHTHSSRYWVCLIKG